MKSTLNELGDYYEQKGILSTNFLCPHRCICFSFVPPEGWFTAAKSAFVGTRYESHEGVEFPRRLLFLALDPGEGKSWPCGEQRTPAAIRKTIEGGEVWPGPHWRGTMVLALRLLSELDVVDLNDYRLSRLDTRNPASWLTVFDNQEELQRLKPVTPWIAQANVVRCSVNAIANKQANKSLYDNCRKYLKGELETLLPDIIVTQGDHAKDALTWALKDCVDGRDGSKCQNGCDPKCSDRCRVMHLGQREALWIRTYHPCQKRGLFRTECKSSWNCYAAAARAFIEGRDHSKLD